MVNDAVKPIDMDVFTKEQVIIPIAPSRSLTKLERKLQAAREAFTREYGDLPGRPSSELVSRGMVRGGSKMGGAAPRPSPLLTISLLPTSTSQWTADKTVFYTPIGGGSSMAPHQFPSKLRTGLINYFTPTKRVTTVDQGAMILERIARMAPGSHGLEAMEKVEEAGRKVEGAGRKVDEAGEKLEEGEGEEHHAASFVNRVAFSPSNEFAAHINRLAKQMKTTPAVILDLLNQEVETMDDESHLTGDSEGCGTSSTAESDGGGSESSPHRNLRRTITAKTTFGDGSLAVQYVDLDEDDEDEDAKPPQHVDISKGRVVGGNVLSHPVTVSMEGGGRSSSPHANNVYFLMGRRGCLVDGPPSPMPGRTKLKRNGQSLPPGEIEQTHRVERATQIVAHQKDRKESLLKRLKGEPSSPSSTNNGELEQAWCLSALSSPKRPVSTRVQTTRAFRSEARASRLTGPIPPLSGGRQAPPRGGAASPPPPSPPRDALSPLQDLEDGNAIPIPASSMPKSPTRANMGWQSSVTFTDPQGGGEGEEVGNAGPREQSPAGPGSGPGPGPGLGPNMGDGRSPPPESALPDGEDLLEGAGGTEGGLGQGQGQGQGQVEGGEKVDETEAAVMAVVSEGVLSQALGSRPSSKKWNRSRPSSSRNLSKQTSQRAFGASLSRQYSTLDGALWNPSAQGAVRPESRVEYKAGTRCTKLSSEIEQAMLEAKAAENASSAHGGGLWTKHKDETENYPHTHYRSPMELDPNAARANRDTDPHPSPKAPPHHHHHHHLPPAKHKLPPCGSGQSPPHTKSHKPEHSQQHTSRQLVPTSSPTAKTPIVNKLLSGLYSSLSAPDSEDQGGADGTGGAKSAGSTHRRGGGVAVDRLTAANVFESAGITVKMQSSLNDIRQVHNRLNYTENSLLPMATRKKKKDGL